MIESRQTYPGCAAMPAGGFDFKERIEMVTRSTVSFTDKLYSRTAYKSSQSGVGPGLLLIFTSMPMERFLPPGIDAQPARLLLNPMFSTKNFSIRICFYIKKFKNLPRFCTVRHNFFSRKNVFPLDQAAITPTISSKVFVNNRNLIAVPIKG